MKILVLGQSLSHILATASYHFYRALAKETECVFIGKGFSDEKDIRVLDQSYYGNDVLKMVDMEKPDIIWLQWEWTSQPEGGWKNLSKVKIPKIGMGGDPWSRLDAKANFAKKYCDCIVLDSGLPSCKVWGGHFKNFPATLFHAGINTKIFRDMNMERIYDVGLFGAINSTYYPIRLFFRNSLMRQSKLRRLTPERGSGVVSTVEGYVKALNQCKIVVCTGEMHYQTGLRINLLTHKYLEGMACNSLVLGLSPIDSPELHFEDGYNIVFVSMRNFLSKLYYYLEHDEERLRIAKNGYDTIQKWHSIDRRALQFVKLCKKVIDGEEIPRCMS